MIEYLMLHNDECHVQINICVLICVQDTF